MSASQRRSDPGGAVESRSEQLPRETPSFRGSAVHEPLYGRDGIGLHFASSDDRNVRILRDANRQQGRLVHAVQRVMQAVVLNE
jgi:hypothetical protein